MPLKVRTNRIKTKIQNPLTYVAILHGSDVRPEATICGSQNGLHARLQLIQRHRKIGKVVHLCRRQRPKIVILLMYFVLRDTSAQPLHKLCLSVLQQSVAVWSLSSTATCCLVRQRPSPGLQACRLHRRCLLRPQGPAWKKRRATPCNCCYTQEAIRMSLHHIKLSISGVTTKITVSDLSYSRMGRKATVMLNYT